MPICSRPARAAIPATRIALFDDVLQKLAADIEVEARARLAKQLARIERAPPKLIRSLAFDDDDRSGRAGLVHSQRLSDADLVENASTKSQEHLFAIAQRLKLSEPVTDVLVERGDRRVVHKVVSNKRRAFLVSRLRQADDPCASPSQAGARAWSAQRPAAPVFPELLETASASVRAELESANPQAAAEIRDTVDDVATGLQHEVRKASRQYAVARRDVNRCFNASPLTEATSMPGPMPRNSSAR